jgi:GntR family transcriptional repressor for pyruvate dehydrogenase complex
MTHVDLSGLQIENRRVGDKVSAYLERLIALGELSPGDKIPAERSIAETLGVSRGSVRDAMQELAHKGLVERRPGRGTVVLDSRAAGDSLYGPLTEAERTAAQVTDLRQAIEPAVAERAASRATPANLLQLERVLAASHARLTPGESVRLDYEFHLLVAQSAQNPLLVALITTTEEWLADSRRTSHATQAGRAASVAGHHKIYQAIAASDPQAARGAMSEHLAEVSKFVTKHTSRHARRNLGTRTGS